MLNRLAVALAVVTFTSLAACKDDKKAEGEAAAGGAGGGGKVASCNMPSAESCREYRGGNLAMGTEMLAKLCMPEIAADAKFSETACPTDKLIATCAKDEGKDYFYEGYAIPPADNEKMCTDGGGTFTTVK